MVEKTKAFGLAYRKLDLHVHTPASKCFKGKSITPEAIIQKALQEKLDAIAITDHNSGDWIDKIKKAAQNILTIFPGIEISSTGGGEGIVHIMEYLILLKIQKTLRIYWATYKYRQINTVLRKHSLN
jgi:predicted metal-dependent phosphoesterase TrpH